MKFSNSKFFASIFILLSAVLIIYLGFNLQNKKLDIRNKAAGTEASLSIYPPAENINLNEEKSFDVIANFTNGSPGEKLTYFKVAVTFAKDILYIQPGKYVDTGKSGFSKVIRVDGPMVANNTGIINVELGAISPGDGPTTNAPLTIAKIYLSGKSVTDNAQFITISKAQVVNAQNSELPVSLGKATYNVVASTNGNASPTVSSRTPTPSPTPRVISNSPSPYNSNPRIYVTSMPTVTTPRSIPTVPISSSAQNQKLPSNQLPENSLPNNQAQPNNSNLYQLPTPTIFFPDYISPTPTKPLSLFTGLSNFFHNIICGIFRVC